MDNSSAIINHCMNVRRLPIVKKSTPKHQTHSKSLSKLVFNKLNTMQSTIFTKLLRPQRHFYSISIL